MLGLASGFAEFAPAVPHVFEVSSGRSTLIVHHEMVQQYQLPGMTNLLHFMGLKAGDFPWLGLSANAPPEVRGCEAAVPGIYALDLMIPFAEFGQQSACHLQATSPELGFPVQLCRSIYQIAGGILTGVTITSMSGILRKD